jgi:uncharacterized repeat protein (TIGR01451 family)
MFKSKYRLTALVVIAVLGFTASTVDAQAACPTAPAITVATSGATHVVGQPVSYSFSGCHNSVGDRYTVQALRVDRDTTGVLIETPATQAAQANRNHQTGAFAGSGSFIPAAEGRYVLRVLYYPVGQAAWEMKGEAIVRVGAAPTPPPAPAPDPDPEPDPAPEPEPTPQPKTAPAADSVPEPTPVPEPQPKPAGKPQPKSAKIAIVKTAVRKTVKAGAVATFKITVRNVSKITARKVKVCDRLPGRTQYVGASVQITFDGPNACTTAKNLQPGKSRSFTIRLKVDRTMTGGKITNRATANAANADSVRDKAHIIVPNTETPRIKAPVTG